MNGPLFAYHSGRQLLVFLDIQGAAYGGALLADVQKVDPKATHAAFVAALPRISEPQQPRIVSPGPITAGLDARLRRR
jgi:hypothetical protein